MKTILTVIITLLGFSLCFSQQSATFKNQQQSQQEAKLLAQTHIKDLKNSVLLVRLKTGKNTIEAMLKAGQNEMAEKKQMQIDRENIQIIKAFRSEFDFCPVYFFYSDDSKAVAEHNFKLVTFLNDSLQPDKLVEITNENFFIAEFGNVSDDTASYYSHTVYEPDGNFSSGAVQVYYGGSNTGAEGLRIMSGGFIQLRKPFPYFAKKSSFRKNEKAIFLTVKKMNLNLWGFYNMGS